MTTNEVKQALLEKFEKEFVCIDEPHECEHVFPEPNAYGVREFLSSALDEIIVAATNEALQRKWVGASGYSGNMEPCGICGEKHRCPKIPYMNGFPRPSHHYDSAKQRAKRSSLEFTINKDYVWEVWLRDKGWKLKRPSIDRIDPTKGYISGNIRFIELLENIGRQSKITPISQKRREASRKNITNYNIAHPGSWNKGRSQPKKYCTYDKCDDIAHALNLCSKHYARQKYRKQHNTKGWLTE